MILKWYFVTYLRIHPTYKQDVAARLALGARAVAYGESNIAYQGPFPSDYQLDSIQHKLTIIFDHGTATLEVKSSNEFEVRKIYLMPSVLGLTSNWLNEYYVYRHKLRLSFYTQLQINKNGQKSLAI